MSSVSINVGVVCAWVLSASLVSIDAVWFAIEDAMKRNEIQGNRRAAGSYDASSKPTMNTRGVLRFAAAATVADKDALQEIHAVISNRFRGAGYVPSRKTGEALV